MIRSDVKNNSDLGMKTLNGFQLKARNLEDNIGIRGSFFDQGNGRRADVTADERLPSSHRDDFTGKRGRRGFAIGTGDGNQMTL